MYKWLIDCIIYCFADPIDDRKSNSSDSSDDGYCSIAEYVEGRYCNSLEEEELEKGATIDQSRPPNCGYDISQINPTKLFEEEVVIVDNQKVTVHAQKISILYIIFPCCCADTSVVDEVKPVVTSSKLLDNLLGNAHHNDLEN